MVTEVRSALNGGGNGDFKIVVVGPRSVGKSALIVRFLTRRFINEYLENTEMTYERKVEVDGQLTHMTIHDTSEKGMELESMLNYCKWANAIMLMYSITDAQSFEELKVLAEKIKAKASSTDDKNESYVPPIVLVANKGDLDYLRKVSREDGFRLAESLHCELYETSARDGWTKQIISHDPVGESHSESESTTVNRRYGAWTIRKSPSVKSPLMVKDDGRMKRWSSYCTLRPSRFQNGRKRDSPVSSTINPSPSSSSPSSDCESDDSLKVSSARNTRRRFMDKLSPLLSRRSLLLQQQQQQQKKLDKPHPHAISNLVECSTSVGGSLHSVKHNNNNNDKLTTVKTTISICERDVSDAQPFVELCREARTRITKSFIRSVSTAVARTKSPTSFLRTSLRKIYHLATEQNNNSMKPGVQSLTVPHFRF